MRVGEALAPTTSASLNLRSCHPGVRKHLRVAPPPGRQLLCTGASKATSPAGLALRVDG
jgi:hypothetical protein